MIVGDDFYFYLRPKPLARWKRALLTIVWIIGTLWVYPVIYAAGADDGVPHAVALLLSLIGWPVILVIGALDVFAEWLLTWLLMLH